MLSRLVKAYKFLYKYPEACITRILHKAEKDEKVTKHQSQKSAQQKIKKLL